MYETLSLIISKYYKNLVYIRLDGNEIVTLT